VEMSSVCLCSELASCLSGNKQRAHAESTGIGRDLFLFGFKTGAGRENREILMSEEPSGSLAKGPCLGFG
jgi:hypothetical protein